MKRQIPAALASTAGRIAAVVGLAVTLTAMAPAISPDVAAPVTDAVNAVMPGDMLLSPPTAEVLAESPTSSAVENSQIDWWTAYVDWDGRCRRECPWWQDCPCLVIEF